MISEAVGVVDHRSGFILDYIHAMPLESKEVFVIVDTLNRRVTDSNDLYMSVRKPTCKGSVSLLGTHTYGYWQQQREQ